MTGACRRPRATASRRSVHGWSRNGERVHGSVDGPLLATRDLEDEDVVHVVVVVEAVVLRGRDVGVGLDGMPRSAASCWQKAMIGGHDAVQRLEHEGGAAREERGELVVAHLVRDAGARPPGAVKAACGSVLPSLATRRNGRPQAALAEQLVDVVLGEQVGEATRVGSRLQERGSRPQDVTRELVDVADERAQRGPVVRSRDSGPGSVPGPAVVDELRHQAPLSAPPSAPPSCTPGVPLGATVGRPVGAAIGAAVLHARRALGATVGRPFGTAVGSAVVHAGRALGTTVGGTFGLGLDSCRLLRHQGPWAPGRVPTGTVVPV